jgi:PAS domain S-box-containing protein
VAEAVSAAAEDRSVGEARVEAGSDIQSLQRAIESLEKGEQLVICVPSAAVAERFRSALLSQNSAGFLDAALLPGKNGEESVARARKTIPPSRTRKLLVVEIAGGDQPWHRKEAHLLAFHEKLSAFLAKRGDRSVWILVRPLVSEHGLARVKDRPRMFLDVTIVGKQTIAQFLAARGFYGPGVFLPRIVQFTDTGVKFSAPILPASDPSSPSGISDLLQAPYKEMFNEAHAGMLLLDVRTGTVDANPRAAEMFGLATGPSASLGLSDVVAPASRVAALRSLSALRGKRKVSEELELRRKSGRTFMAHVSASILGGSRALVILRDLSDEVRLHRDDRMAMTRLAAVTEASAVPQCIVAGKKLVYANRVFSATFSANAAATAPARDFFGKRNASFLKSLSSAEEAGQATCEGEVSFGDGDDLREFLVTAAQTLWEERNGWHLSLTDVTRRNAAVRSLRSSETTLRDMLHRQAGAVSVVRDGKFLFVNSAFAAMFAFQGPAELVGKDASSTVAPRGKEDYRNRLVPGVPGKSRGDTFEYAGRTAEGDPLTVSVAFESIMYEGTPAVLCHHTDITASRGSEEEMRRRGRESAILDHLSRDLHRSLDPLDVMTQGLRSALKWLGGESGGVYLPDSGGEALHLELAEGLTEKLATTLADQPVREGLTGFIAKTAEPVLLELSAYPAHLPYKSLFESEGIRSAVFIPLVAGESLQGIAFLCSSKEPTVAARDEILLGNIARHFGEALGNALRFHRVRAEAEKYRAVLESLPDVAYEANAAGTFSMIAPQIERLSGHRPDEFIRNPDLWRTIIHPDDRASYSMRVTEQGAGEECLSLEYRVLPKGKAEYRRVRDTLRYRRSPDGAVVAITGMLIDATVDAAAGRSDPGAYMVADALQSVQEGVVVYDRELRYQEWNRAMELITGVERSQVVGKSAFEGTPRFELSDFPELLHRALAGNAVSSEDVEYTREGSLTASVLWCRFSPLRDAGGAITGVVGTVTDVTHRKSLERELRESEETLRNVIDTMGDALMICDLQGKVWEVNREFSNLTGLGRQEVIGNTFPYPWLMEEQMSRFVVWLAALREKKYLRDFDMTWKRVDGREVAISLNTTLLRNALDEPVAMLNLARDISERKGLSDELAGKNRQIEMLNRIISKANSTMEFSRVFDAIAEEVRALVSFDQINVALLSDDRLGLTVHAAVGTGPGLPSTGESLSLAQTVSRFSVARREAVIASTHDPNPAVRQLMGVDPGGIRTEISIPVMLNERVLGTFNLASRDEDAFSYRELSFLQPIADQIGPLIDRMLLFQKVTDDSNYIHNLLNSIESVVYTVDQNSVVREVNTAWREFAVLQGTPELKEESQVIGRPLDEIIAAPILRSELPSVLPRLLDGTVAEFSREFEVGMGERGRSFQLGVTPLAVHGKVTGLVFTYTDITQSKQTEAEILRRNEELVALNAVASSINKSLDLENVLGVTAQQVRALSRADIVIFYLRDGKRSRLAMASNLGVPAGLAERIRLLPLDELREGVSPADGTMLTLEGGQGGDLRVTEAGKEEFRAVGAQSVLAIPLASKDRILGALIVGFTVQYRFTDKEERFLKLVGNQIGSALENVQLYAEVQAQVRRTTLLYEIGRGLAGTLDTRTILSVVHAELKKSLTFDRFVFGSLAGPSGPVAFQFDQGDGEAISPAEEGIRLSIEGKSFQGVLADGRTLSAVPVRSQGGVLGVFALVVRSAVDESLLRLLESIANLTEIAVDRAILYEDTVAKSEEIEHRNKELDDFTYVVSHDLKEPLITIEGYSKIVLNDYREKVDEEGRGYLSSVVKSSQRMKSLIDDLLTLSRIGRLSELQESLPVRDVIDEVLHDFEFSLKESTATVNVPDTLPVVRYNRTQLGMVFRNLLGNAIKFNRSTAPRIDISLTEGEKEYTFAVRDNGIGIEQQHFDRIFVIFQRLHRSEEFRGTGAGLTIVKKIVENHHGRIWVESAVGEGTTFYFTIPK